VLTLNELIDSNNLCINNLILAELLPSINHKKETDLKELILTIEKIDMLIDWHQIIIMQTTNLKNGINEVGISDLIIAQNAIENNIELYAIDKHFALMSEVHELKLFRR
ncbi:MAG TPA: PIN domain-containing protein, partial [Ignavibacteriaceae bacterium]|nr:PIN domain-containing protein [Ignavibacteriaceae bacterium]